jgi:5-methylthioadenosine/S-adenosylhomocysteine deaminase
MKLASGGVAPVPELVGHGVNVALGTDGVSSNNSVNMFEEMKHASLIQKSTRWDARVLPAQQVFDFATRGGAALLGASNNLGSLEVGKIADVVLVDRRKPSLVPMYAANIVSNLVYGGGTDIVRDVIVGGELVLRDGRSTKVDEGRVVDDAQRAAVELIGVTEA